MNKEVGIYHNLKINFIDMSSGDPTAVMAKEQGFLGFNRLSICMEKLGLKYQNNYFIALPDYTYTRNILRWNAGFPYGCIISIDQTIPFIPVDFRPNCCGIIFAEVPEDDFDIFKLKDMYHNLLYSYSDINPTDFNRRNHFFGLYYNEGKKKYYFMIHGSFMFAKKGLYIEKNKDLLSKKETMDILGFPFSFLRGKEAEQYYNNYQHYAELSNYYRELIMKTLFPKANILFHCTHEGFLNRGTLLLGAYASFEPFNCPIMLAPEENLPYVSVNKPLRFGLDQSIYCAPHGGGYALSSVINAVKTERYGNEFLVTYSNNLEMLTNNIIDMPFYYRKSAADLWCNKYNKGRIVEILKPLFNMKI